MTINQTALITNIVKVKRKRLEHMTAIYIYQFCLKNFGTFAYNNSFIRWALYYKDEIFR